MAFVNEYIPKEDFEKYHFAELNKRPRKGGTTARRDWTIDRESNIWLRKFYSEFDHTAPDGRFTGVSVWDFYWKGVLMRVEVKTLEIIGGGIGQSCWMKKKLLSIDIPSEFESRRSLILTDLEVAFTAHKDSGVLSQSSSFSFSLEI